MDDGNNLATGTGFRHSRGKVVTPSLIAYQRNDGASVQQSRLALIRSINLVATGDFLDRSFSK